MTDCKPSFLLSKGQRNKLQQLDDISYRYREIAKGIYEWSGLPEDVPDGYIEECLFDVGCVSAKDVKGIGVSIFPASPATHDIYGQPVEWLPSGITTTESGANEILVEIMSKSDTPCLYLDKSIYDQIKPYVTIMNHSLISLKQNTIALRQPIALDGDVGNNVDAKIHAMELSNGEQFIPVISAKRQGMEVIDLKAQDHIQSLISAHSAMDAEILSIMGIKNRGTEKASGITAEETLSVTQELAIKSDLGLKVRQKWCDKINAILGTSFEVRIAEAYIMEDSDSDSIPDSLDNRDGKEPEEI